MHGSLALGKGIVWLARFGKHASVRAYDLDGHRLGPGFEFGTQASGAPWISGLEVDGEHGLWIADEERGSVRGFSVFGVEGATLGAGSLGKVSCVAARGEDDHRELWVGSRGGLHNAVQCFAPTGERIGALRCLGDPAGVFRDVEGIGLGETLLYVCEARAGRVQVFREREFHFVFDLGAGQPFEPTAAAALDEGRVLVTSRGTASGLYLFDQAGRCQARLAEAGEEEGQLLDPSDVVVEPGKDDQHSRVLVVDRDGDRVQVFSLAGRCYGSFPELD